MIKYFPKFYFIIPQVLTLFSVKTIEILLNISNRCRSANFYLQNKLEIFWTLKSVMLVGSSLISCRIKSINFFKCSYQKSKCLCSEWKIIRKIGECQLSNVSSLTLWREETCADMMTDAKHFILGFRKRNICNKC